MPRKKSAQDAADRFLGATHEVRTFLDETGRANLTDRTQSRVHDQAIMATAVAFEHLMLHCLVAAVNNNTATISATTGVDFPKHLTDEVCEYLVTGGRYFNFNGRSGLIDTVQKFVGTGHWLHLIVKDPRHQKDLDLLIALRNHVAHGSKQGKKAAGLAMRAYEPNRRTSSKDPVRFSSAGAWVKCGRRMTRLLDGLDQLAKEVSAAAPY